MDDTSPSYSIQAASAKNKPLLQLTAEHRAAAERRLRELGIPDGAWYVCVHCREGGYDANDRYHTARNSKIESFVAAMQAIVARGGWCIRMGDPSMRPLPNIAGVVDYAHSPLRCDWMDIFLCASCRFFLGTASGLNLAAAVFGVRSANANQALPIQCLSYGTNDFMIMKLLWSSILGRYLTFGEIGSCPIGDARFTECYQLQQLEAHENAVEDIRDLVVEMLDDIDGCFVETEEDRRLQAMFHSVLRPGRFAFGAKSRIGRMFLRKYRHLLVPEAAPAPPFHYTPIRCSLNSFCFCLRQQAKLWPEMEQASSRM